MVTVKVDELEGEALDYVYRKKFTAVAIVHQVRTGLTDTDQHKRDCLRWCAPTVQIPAELVKEVE